MWEVGEHRFDDFQSKRPCHLRHSDQAAGGIEFRRNFFQEIFNRYGYDGITYPKKKTIGLRVPDSEIPLGLLGALGEPMMTTTMRLPDDTYPLTDPEDVRDALEKSVDLVIDGGHCGVVPTTVVDLTLPGGEVVREGLGEFE